MGSGDLTGHQRMIDSGVHLYLHGLELGAHCFGADGL